MGIKDIARKITGLSIGPVGASWKPADETERTVVRKFILFLENRRVLHSPASGHSVASHFVIQGLDRSPCLSPRATESILTMREEIQKLLGVVPERSPGSKTLKRLAATCRWALDCADRMAFDVVRHDSDYEDVWACGTLEYGITFLGLFRRKMGRDIKELAALYDIPIEGPLQKMIKMTTPVRELDRQIFEEADSLVRPYMIRHSGFKNMKSAWFERLCKEQYQYTRDWENEE